MYYLTIVTADGKTTKINEVDDYWIDGPLKYFCYKKGRCIAYYPFRNLINVISLTDVDDDSSDKD